MKKQQLAIDLGTANSLVIDGTGVIVVREPTVVAYSRNDNKIIAVGTEAKSMLGKAPEGIIVKRPMKQGVIASFQLTKALLRHLIKKSSSRSIFTKPEVMISVPAGLTSVEERAVIEAASEAGASKIYLLPEPIAAAIGAKLPVSSTSGSMIANMGGGTAEIAVISLNGLVKYASKRLAGDAINESIQDFFKEQYNLIIGELMAERVKIDIGSAIAYENPYKMDVTGSDALTGQPKSVSVSSNDILPAILTVCKQIITSIQNVLEETPPELASDIIDRGIVLSGGTALIHDIDVLFSDALGVPVHVVEEPLTAVVEGVAEGLRHMDILKRNLKQN
ncbi:rod shape-determining protein [Candidatus Dojkabacteria bacterium]|uniref:Cell shape-determining protein MreB n=1 Tax=Candidatus Dojkabacteria bacterium TaxID=2099670 RepID=A0A955L8L2_9BACT|nr:rod shape-determining protein [Candidatus Dojkabacteria bacterium]